MRAGAPDDGSARIVRVEEWTWAAGAAYSQAVVAGGLVLTCGVAPFGDDGSIVARGDLAGQFRQVVANLDRLLAAAGSSLDRIVRQHVFLRREADLDAFRAVRTQLYRLPYPASVTVVVTAMAHPDMLIEIACEAVLAEPA